MATGGDCGKKARLCGVILLKHGYFVNEIVQGAVKKVRAVQKPSIVDRESAEIDRFELALVCVGLTAFAVFIVAQWFFCPAP